MLRGNTLFADIFIDEAPKCSPKGRSPEFNAKRNDCLIDRYYYYGRFMKLNYGYILDILHTEFFLSVSTIQEIITDHSDKLRAIRTQSPDTKHFRQKWPHLVWPDPVPVHRAVRA